MQYIDYGAVQARRELFFAEPRQALNSYVNPDGSGRIPQFEPPWREVLWILPALYRGGAENIALANRMAARFHSAAPAYQPEIGRLASGKLRHGGEALFGDNFLINHKCSLLPQ